jgi:hypothetical protein
MGGLKGFVPQRVYILEERSTLCTAPYTLRRLVAGS